VMWQRSRCEHYKTCEIWNSCGHYFKKCGLLECDSVVW
jgi:hypothetical protein